jgi:hypothetical protein
MMNCTHCVSESRDRATRDLEKTEREIARLIDAIKAGVPGAAVKDEMATLEAKRIELLAQLQAAPPSMPRLHPNLAELYRQKVVNLSEALNDDDTRQEAGECIRELIEEIRLVPDNGKLRAELYGELAALINLANEHPRSKGTGVQVTLVAGARFAQERTKWTTSAICTSIVRFYRLSSRCQSPRFEARSASAPTADMSASGIVI